jgi:hypothetical protein
VHENRVKTLKRCSLNDLVCINERFKPNSSSNLRFDGGCAECP